VAEVVTYRSDGRRFYCQLKLNSGERVFVQIAFHEGRQKLLIHRMGFGGLVPRGILWEMAWEVENMPIFLELFGEPSGPPSPGSFLDAVIATVKRFPSIQAMRDYLDQQPRVGRLGAETMRAVVRLLASYLHVLAGWKSVFPRHESMLPAPKEAVRRALLKYFDSPELQQQVGLEAVLILGARLQRLLVDASGEWFVPMDPSLDYDALPDAEKGGLTMFRAYSLLAYFIPDERDARVASKVHAVVFEGSQGEVSDEEFERDSKVLRHVEAERRRLSDELRRRLSPDAIT
jgi:hypothetical protein